MQIKWEAGASLQRQRISTNFQFGVHFEKVFRTSESEKVPENVGMLNCVRINRRNIK